MLDMVNRNRVLSIFITEATGKLPKLAITEIINNKASIGYYKHF